MKVPYEHSRLVLQVDPDYPHLYRGNHASYLKRGLLQALPAAYAHLDCSRAWVAYWIVHPLRILGIKLDAEEVDRTIKTLIAFRNKTGGFGGGSHQLSHLAATYAAVNALVTLETEEALKAIDKDSMYQFLLSVKQPDGSYIMHTEGEPDVRGVYCALAVSTICGIKDDKLTENCVEWIVSCQTYEGGFGGFPGCEAHGGYTFCAVAALVLLNGLDKCNFKSLLRFVSNRQLPFEGGFSGRTNKLVDACYSFWVGGVFPILHAYLFSKGSTIVPTNHWLFNQRALQEYLLCCCQETTGGLFDKPGKRRDFYHTCYSIAGLSVAQNNVTSKTIVGNTKENKLLHVHPLYNIDLLAVKFAETFFHYFYCVFLQWLQFRDLL